MDNIETMDIKTIAKMAGLKYNTVFKTLQKNKIEPAKILGAIEANRETNQNSYEIRAGEHGITSNDEAFKEGLIRIGAAQPRGTEPDENIFNWPAGGGSDENNDDSGETLDLDESTEMTAGDEYLPNPCVKYLTSDLIGWFVQLYGDETTKTILANDYGIGI